MLALLTTLALVLVAPAPPGRVVALGDLHGDAAAAVTALTAAGLIDADLHWSGGDATLVQLGDVLDRGGEEFALWGLLERLRLEARSAGGRVVTLLGNHEVLNALGKAATYVHPAGHDQFGDDRCAAFRPGGALAARLADDFPVVAVVGDSVFAHASLPRGATLGSLARLNAETRAWLLGERPAGPPPLLLGGRDSPVWDRTFSAPGGEEPAASDCEALRDTLRGLGASRLVVGHTPQTRVNGACGGAVWRCDTGCSRWVMCGPVEALEIQGGAVRVLRRGTAREAARDALLTAEDALAEPECGEAFLN